MKETIKKLREQNNYSQSALAELLHISRQMYVKYENGEVDPPVKIIMKLCSLYKVSYDFIIDNKLSKIKSSNIHSEVTYDNNIGTLEIASPVPAYGSSVGYKNKSTWSFEMVVEALRKIPEEQFSSILAFINFLSMQNQEIKATKPSAISNKRKSKENFFNLAGKINLDQDELTEFREKSLI